MKKKILVVEDEEGLRLLYKEELEAEGYEVLTAGNGREAIQQLETGRPDLVILDIVMPVMDGMEALGFRCLLPRAVQAPIIVTFHMPTDPKFDFGDFYERLSDKGFLIYPGKLTVADSFRVGCIGRLGETEMRAALDTIAAVLDEMGVHDLAPVPTA